MAARVVWHGERITRQVRTEMSRRTRQAVAEVDAQVKRNISVSARSGGDSGRAGSSLPGEFPRANRGMLRKAIFHDMTDDLTGIVGVDKASPAAKYAGRLEDGGVIRSHGKLMAIPISKQAKAHSFNGGPRTLGIHLVLIRRHNRPPLLVEIPKGSTHDKPGRKAWIIHYVLSPTVTILARPYLSRTAMEMRPRIKAIYEAPLSLT